MHSIRQNLIRCGHAEGISFLILLFIAMPMKYMADMPMAVKIAGSIHGILFLMFIAFLWDAKKSMPLSLMVSAKAFVLALIPFGTFFIPKILPVKTD